MNWLSHSKNPPIRLALGKSKTNEQGWYSRILRWNFNHEYIFRILSNCTHISTTLNIFHAHSYTRFLFPCLNIYFHFFHMCIKTVMCLLWTVTYEICFLCKNAFLVGWFCYVITHINPSLLGVLIFTVFVAVNFVFEFRTHSIIFRDVSYVFLFLSVFFVNMKIITITHKQTNKHTLLHNGKTKHKHTGATLKYKDNSDIIKFFSAQTKIAKQNTILLSIWSYMTIVIIISPIRKRFRICNQLTSSSLCSEALQSFSKSNEMKINCKASISK